MDGYCIGEPHFSQRLEEDVNTLMKALKDPALPLLELQVRYPLAIPGSYEKVSCDIWIVQANCN